MRRAKSRGGPIKEEFGDEIDFSKIRCSLKPLNRSNRDQNVATQTDPNQPIEFDFNPFDKADRKCLLCDLGIKLDYKNARLLQQFISSFSGRVYDRHITGLCSKQHDALIKTIKMSSGRVYDRHITGLCSKQHDALIKTIKMSRYAGYMPPLTKEPKYLKDPKLFDPLKPIRPHSYDG
uniref:Mitochondrial ribosomal protein S18C n=1 Tax=Meloidogyne javanica TaxID=6303 RepID=A0A915LZN6_MELJA